jgi:hypothetical protein
MANVEHSALTDPNLHEPKGLTGTSHSGRVYVSNGSASGAWTARQDLITVHIHDISTATDIYVPIINAGTVSKLQTVTSAAIAGSDLIITAYNSSSASMGNLTVTQSGSAAGDVDEKLPTSNNTVTAGSYIRLNSNGGPTSHVDVMLLIAVDRTS